MLSIFCADADADLSAFRFSIQNHTRKQKMPPLSQATKWSSTVTVKVPASDLYLRIASGCKRPLTVCPYSNVPSDEAGCAHCRGTKLHATEEELVLLLLDFQDWKVKSGYKGAMEETYNLFTFAFLAKNPDLATKPEYKVVMDKLAKILRTTPAGAQPRRFS
jgi:hypothetical protein